MKHLNPRLSLAWAILLALVVLMGLLAVPGSRAAARTGSTASADRGVIEDSYIVAYKRSVQSASAETGGRERRLGFRSSHRFSSALKGFAAKLSPGQVSKLRSDPEVDFVSPNRRVEASAAVPLAGSDSAPTGVRRILAGSASTAREASGVNVAVIDTGILLSHGDLNAVSGTNCISPGSSADDDNGHGTHVAGTIAAKNNGTGVVGVAPGTKTYAVKVLDSKGNGSTASVVCGIDWVTANHASLDIRVANMSLGGSGSPVTSCATTTDAEHAAICTATAAGVNFVVAAGNSGWDFDYQPQPDVPAAYPEVLTVSALTDSDGAGGGSGPSPACRTSESDDTPASFSNFALTSAGAAHTIAAPGVCILSTWHNGGYDTISGTSMASPHMAGIVARCVNEGGVDGPCAALTPAATISYLRTHAADYTGANPDYGFTGDASSAGTNFYGFLTGPLSGTTTPTDPPVVPGPTDDGSGATGGTGAAAVAPPATAPSTTAPTPPARPNFAGARRSIRVRNGRFRYTFRAGAFLRGSAQFRSVRAVQVSARRRVTLARKSFAVPGTGRVTVRVKLSRRNLRILKRNRRITVRVTVKLRNSAGLTSTGTRRLTLRI